MKLFKALLCSSLLLGETGLPVAAMEELPLAAEETTILHEGTIGSADWSIDSNGLLTIGAGSFHNEDPNYYWPWAGYLDEVTRIDGSAAFTPSGSLHRVFGSAGYSTIEEVDVSGWDITGVTDLSGMFEHAASLSRLTFGAWNTQNVLDFSDMFSFCTSLSELDVSVWDLSMAADLSRMFQRCESLKQIDVEAWDVSQAERFTAMFSGCEALESLDLSRWNTSSAQDMEEMFDRCARLTSLDLSAWNMSNVRTAKSMFSFCSMLTSLSVRSWNLASLEDMSFMFWGCSALQSLDLAEWETSSVRDMSGLFGNCASLEGIEVGNWDLSNVKSIDRMFYDCRNLEVIDVGSWNVSGVEDFSQAFSHCKRVKMLDVANWDLGCATTIRAMFWECSALESLDVSAWDTASVEKMSYVFALCPSLRSIDVSRWNTISANTMFSMFNGCSVLESLDLSLWDTSLVTDMAHMFRNCSSLEELELGGFDTSLVTNIRNMFTGCTSLKSLDLANWNLGSLQYSDEIFTDCTALERLTFSSESFLLPTLLPEKEGWYLNSEGPYSTDALPSLAGHEIATLTKGIDLLAAEIDGIDDAYAWTGKAITPKPSVRLNGKTLRRGVDYMLSYRNNRLPGQAEVIVTPMDHAVGERIVSFAITPLDLTDCTVSDLPDRQTWTGEPIEPAITVTDGKKTLEEGTDYTLTFENNVNPGEASVLVNGTGGYAGKKRLSFVIDPISLSDASIEGVAASYPWTGSPVMPEVIVQNDGKTLVKDRDYTLTFQDNAAPGKAALTVSGTGGYTGTKTVYFEITALDLQDVQISGIEASYPWSKDALCPEPVVMRDGQTLLKDRDYTLAWSDNLRPGTATLTITGIGGYTGSRKISFEILLQELETFTISGIEAQYTWTGSAIEPVPVVCKDGQTLECGKDYLLSYSNTVQPGCGSVTVTGIGGYTGSQTIEFEIVPVDLGGFAIDGLPESIPWSGSAILPDFSLSDGKKTLVKNKDYLAGCSNNVQPGKALLTITGIGGYTGTLSADFTITPLDLSSAKIANIDSFYDWSGEAIEPEPLVTFNGDRLKKDVDYSVSYAHSIGPGEAEVTITGKGGYAGSQTMRYTIRALSVSEVSIEGIDSSYAWTGEGIHPEPLIRIGEKTLTKGKDYILLYADAIRPGKATLLIIGLGGCTGSRQIEYTITPLSLSGSTVEGVEETYTWTGSPIEPVLMVKKDGRILEEGKDFLQSFSNTTQPGTASIRLQGIGGCSGSLEIQYEIVPLDISQADIGHLETVYPWLGSAVLPDPALSLNGHTLERGKDYLIGYTNASQPGEASLTITGIGGCTGSKTLHYTISRQDLSAVQIEGIDASYDWTGQAIVPDPIVRLDGRVLEKEQDYTLAYQDNTDPGKATVRIQGINRYDGERILTFTIEPLSLETATVSGIEESYNWSADGVKPRPTVALGKKTLVIDQDYTLSWSQTAAPGLAALTITGKGGYAGRILANYTITPLDLKEAKIEGISASYPWTGSSIQPEPVVKVDGRTLVKGTDYLLVHTGTIQSGQASILIFGMGGYTGSRIVTYEIKPADLSAASIEGIAASYSWTGREIRPVPAVKLGGRQLVEGRDYVLSFTDTIGPGTATLTITGQGSYTGRKSVPYAITRRDLSKAAVSGLESSYVWNGEPIAPQIQITLGGKVLKFNEDYTLTWSNNTKPGKGSVTISGKGGYTGSLAKTFDIVERHSATAPSVTMYRLYNPNSGEHFYTAAKKEKDMLLKAGWKDEGEGWKAPEKSNAPVYRLYNANAGDHHYTLDAKEKDMLLKAGWKDEGIGWYSDDAKSVPLYRQYNPNAKAGSHNYTTDKKKTMHWSKPAGKRKASAGTV